MSSRLPARERRDFVIIGARCAGATLATYLARAGASVLLVDRSPLPSDLVLSTHTLHPASLEVLDELGLADALRAVTPPVRKLRIGRGSGTFDVTLADERVEYCPRRERFDGLLQDAARASGAGGLRSNGSERAPVAGRSGRGRAARRASRRARSLRRLVVGADGRDSWLARRVSAEEYLQYEAMRAMYWSYWTPAGLRRLPDYPAGMYVVNRDGVIRVAFHTDHDQVLVGSMPERQRLSPWRSDPARDAAGTISSRDEMLASFTARSAAGKVRGFIAQRYFLRRPVGPGWLLIGDAGVHKEFVTGDGMTEALAPGASRRSTLGRGEAGVEVLGTRRDAAAPPFFFFGKIQGAPGAPSELEALALRHSARTSGHRAALRPELVASSLTARGGERRRGAAFPLASRATRRRLAAPRPLSARGGARADAAAPRAGSSGSGLKYGFWHSGGTSQSGPALETVLIDPLPKSVVLLQADLERRLSRRAGSAKARHLSG